MEQGDPKTKTALRGCTGEEWDGGSWAWDECGLSGYQS